MTTRLLRCQNSKGATILGVLLSSVIISMVFLCFMGSLYSSTKGNRNTLQRNTAVYLAQQKLEELINRAASNYSSLDSLVTTPEVGDFAGNASKYSFRCYAKDNFSGSLRDLGVTVTWNQNGKTYSVFLSTKIASPQKIP